ncbi:hypothetical protein HBH47_179300 [Parastagonospora nodorum]|nr:hypothetical protein HBH47_179300 [Parastagonospora nodorum]KAH4943717.1 hypothetical protein HBI79_021850 [Parastagonospora nodorum]KAH5367005.1 hypothetical protein HBI33_182050 [Parastagonospora nodorum]
MRAHDGSASDVCNLLGPPVGTNVLRKRDAKEVTPVAVRAAGVVGAATAGSVAVGCLPGFDLHPLPHGQEGDKSSDEINDLREAGRVGLDVLGVVMTDAASTISAYSLASVLRRWVGTSIGEVPVVSKAPMLKRWVGTSTGDTLKYSSLALVLKRWVGTSMGEVLVASFAPMLKRWVGTPIGDTPKYSSLALMLKCWAGTKAQALGRNSNRHLMRVGFVVVEVVLVPVRQLVSQRRSEIAKCGRGLVVVRGGCSKSGFGSGIGGVHVALALLLVLQLEAGNALVLDQQHVGVLADLLVAVCEVGLEVLDRLLQRDGQLDAALEVVDLAAVFLPLLVQAVVAHLQVERLGLGVIFGAGEGVVGGADVLLVGIGAGEDRLVVRGIGLVVVDVALQLLVGLGELLVVAVQALKVALVRLLGVLKMLPGLLQLLLGLAELRRPLFDRASLADEVTLVLLDDLGGLGVLLLQVLDLLLELLQLVKGAAVVGHVLLLLERRCTRGAQLPESASSEVFGFDQLRAKEPVLA